jgi:hypothetical protein
MTGGLTFEALDPAVASAEPANARVVAVAAALASPQPESVGLPWAVGGFAVGAHPDLVERLAEVGELAGLALRFLYGLPVLLAASGVIVAAANGMREIDVRAAPVAVPDVLFATGGATSASARFGKGWARLAAWPVAISRTDALPMLAAACRAAAR